MGKSTFVFLVFYVTVLLDCSAQKISTVAGNGFNAKKGYGGYSGDGGPATGAELYFPTDVVFDKKGNMYIADGNSCIRKIETASGIISTVAGNGKLGKSGDGEPATDAQLSFPTGLTLDASGNIYIADLFNNQIRKVNISTGIITTIAGNGYKALSNKGGYGGDGGPATNAELDAPEGIAIDVRGNLYIADCNNNVIRKVAASTGIITTIVGNGAKGYSGDNGKANLATLFSPSSIAFDAGNNLYIADRDNNVIRKVNMATGIITTVAGTTSSGYGGDGGAATAARLSGPRNISFDAFGNMYIADFYNNAVRRVSSTGIITTVAKTGAHDSLTGLLQPACAVSDVWGNIFIADEGNNIIQKVAMASDPSKPIREIAKKYANPNEVVYEVQLLATKNKLPEGVTVAGSKQRTFVAGDTGNLKYGIGTYTNRKDAEEYLKQLKAMGYTDAFITTTAVGSTQPTDAIAYTPQVH
ncbi:MAG TPA: hypothetical protein VK809_07690 [Bacteroidia bacterium]|jgi:sugar lactone lactonase YvrE|nr:hypothetical protein [Bacteroidia bacterium]